jgi:hypothetical protein
MRPVSAPAVPLVRTAARDRRLVAGAAVHAVVLALRPPAPVVAALLLWNANTVSHNFIHNPFFRSRAANRAFSAALTLLLGFPQDGWRERHLAHHAGRPVRVRPGAALAFECALVLGLAGVLAWRAPSFLLAAWLPGLAGGLALCALQGRYEHAGGGTIDHHGRLYNLLFANDGYHAAHHADPGLHWSALPAAAARPDRVSRWPAVLRFLDAHPLDALERVVLRSRTLQRFVLARHERALRRLLGDRPRIDSAAVVGGGLFPRTAILLARLLPGARITVIDAEPAHLLVARDRLPPGTRCVAERYDPRRHRGFDLVVVPLAYRGDRETLYRDPPAQVTLVHDWLWRRRGESAVVSPLLAKRLNLVRAEPA